MAPEREIPISVLMRYFRVPVPPMPVDYPGRDILLGSCITNVSVTGVFVRTAHPLSCGTEIEVAFRLPDGEQEIRGVAVVRWVKKIGAQAAGTDAPGMGIEFVKISRKAQRQLERFVRSFLTRMRA